MVAELKIGASVSLNPNEFDVSKIKIGFGWRTVKSGMFKKLFSADTGFDLDAAAILLDQANLLHSEDDVVYFGNLRSYTGAVSHSGDTSDGSGKATDEEITISFKDLPSKYKKIVFFAIIHKAQERKQTFKMLDSGFAEIRDAQGKAMMRFNFTAPDSKAKEFYSMLVGELVQTEGLWQLNILGEFLEAARISKIAERYV